MVKGIVTGLDSLTAASSPTFSLLHLYPGRLLLLHLDLYRLETTEELDELGWEEYLGRSEYQGQPTASIIEWPERMAGLLPSDRLEIFIEQPEPGVDIRIFRFLATGPQSRRLLESIPLRLCTET